jgi:hypothetical protein
MIPEVQDEQSYIESVKARYFSKLPAARKLFEDALRKAGNRPLTPGEARAFDRLGLVLAGLQVDALEKAMGESSGTAGGYIVPPLIPRHYRKLPTGSFEVLDEKGRTIKIVRDAEEAERLIAEAEASTRKGRTQGDLESNNSAVLYQGMLETGESNLIGEGRIPESEKAEETCPVCGGDGWLVQTNPGQQRQVTCYACGGTGISSGEAGTEPMKNEIIGRYGGQDSDDAYRATHDLPLQQSVPNH